MDSYEIQINQINERTEVIRSSHSFADDPNLLRNSFNNVAMQHQVPSQVDRTCNTHNTSSRTHRKMKTSDNMKVKRDFIKNSETEYLHWKNFKKRLQNLLGKIIFPF